MYINSFPYHFRRKRHERDSNNIVDAAGGGSMVRYYAKRIVAAV